MSRQEPFSSYWNGEMRFLLGSKHNISFLLISQKITLDE